MNSCFWRHIALLVVSSACTLAPCSRAQLTNFSRIHSFGHPLQSGLYPVAPLVEASDGWLYGTAETSDEFEGAVFKMRRDGRDYTAIHLFVYETDGARNPTTGLLEASDGALYGSTRGGGQYYNGTIYKLNKDGSGYAVLHSFEREDGSFANPGSLVEGSDGALYSTVANGGPDSMGSVFKIRKDGSGFAERWSFRAPGTNGAGPVDGVILGTDGLFYGACSSGGLHDAGVIYTVGQDGGGYAVLHHFHPAGGDGGSPSGRLLEARDGRLYGVTFSGGSQNAGTIFGLDKDGTNYAVLRSFGGNGDALNLISGLIEVSAGVLYGTSTYGGQPGLGTIFRINTDGSGYSTLHQFMRTNSAGSAPMAPLCLAGDGLLYGTAPWGGSNGNGTVFRLLPQGGTPQTLWTFQYTDGGDGLYPRALVEGHDGFLYATAWDGGTASSGALVRSSKDGADYTVLHSFWTGIGANGAWDEVYAGPLMQTTDRVLYGISSGGEHGEPPYLYRIGSDGRNYTAIHTFDDSFFNGERSSAGVMEASDGALYGTTLSSSNTGGGYLFRVSKETGQYDILREFGVATNEGVHPMSILLEASDGRLYGETYGSWESANGVLFGVDKDGGGYRDLHRFGRRPNFGGGISPTFFEGSDGFFYGVTYGGDGAEAAAVYRLDRGGSNYVVLRDIAAEPGLPPITRMHGMHVVEGRDGAVYGTLWFDWDSRRSLIFKLNKDGTGFRALAEQGFDSPMIAGSDGAFYGLSRGPYPAGLGSIVRLGHALSLELAAGGAHLGLTGLPGYAYRLERSTDLSNWTLLQTVVMPDSLRVQYDDATPPAGAAFYRLRVP